MKIMPLNSNAQNFKGPPDSSVREFVYKCILNERKTMQIGADVQALDKYAEALISQIDDFMGHLHPKTVLSFEKTKNGNDFFVRNRMLPKKVKLKLSGIKGTFFRAVTTDVEHQQGSHVFNAVRYKDMEILSLFFKQLGKFNPKFLDKELFMQAREQVKKSAQNTGFIGQIRTMVQAVKADNFAVAIGEDATTFRDAGDWIDEAQLKKHMQNGITNDTGFYRDLLS